jgi:pyruvate dehydrogenase E2 component (dihydrolipoamide acetyltransferase)
MCEPGEERIRLSHMRKIIADRMLYSKTHIPHACGMDFVDVTKLVEIRQKEKAKFAEKGVKLTYLPFIMKAAAIALKQMPDFNAHFDMEQNFIVRKKRFNIGLAVDTPDGLMVPVVKDLERKSMISIASEIETLASQARERKIKLDDLKGGTFTITNVGSVGGMYSSPIINPPEVAILGVHRIKDLPLVVNGQIVARKVMGISLCFDHRVVDGAAATEFMNIIKRHLEDPDLLLVDMS